MASCALDLTAKLSRLSLARSLFDCESSKIEYLEGFEEKISSCFEFARIFHLTLKSIPHVSLEISSIPERLHLIDQIAKAVFPIIENLNQSHPFGIDALGLETLDFDKKIHRTSFMKKQEVSLVESLDLQVAPIPFLNIELPVDEQLYFSKYRPKSLQEYKFFIDKNRVYAQRFLEGIQFYKQVLEAGAFFREHLDPTQTISSLFIPRLTKDFVKMHTISVLDLIKDKKIGEGTFGKVYRVFLQYQPYAFKTFKKSIHPGGHSREENYILEASVMLCLPCHPALLHIQALCNRSFMLPYADRGTLYDKMAKAEYNSRDLFEYFINIAEGLESMHQAGFTHKDVKANNILLFSEPPRARLGDFSLSSLTLHDDCKEVSIHYKPPELFFADEVSMVSQATDVWSFGIVLFECLTGGCLPFFEERRQAPDFYPVLAKERFRKPCTPEELIDGLHHKNVKILLEKDPNRILLNVCCACLHGDPLFRVRMAHVIHILKAAPSSS